MKPQCNETAMRWDRNAMKPQCDETVVGWDRKVIVGFRNRRFNSYMKSKHSTNFLTTKMLKWNFISIILQKKNHFFSYVWLMVATENPECESFCVLLLTYNQRCCNFKQQNVVSYGKIFWLSFKFMCRDIQYVRKTSEHTKRTHLSLSTGCVY